MSALNVGPDGARVHVVIPTYDEARNIVSLIERLRAAVPGASILVVDDSSPDGTAELVAEMARRDHHVAVLRRTSKAGLGAAYRAGFAVAIERGAAICVQMDADHSHDPKFVGELVSAVAMGADAAIGSRYVPGGACVNWPYLRRFLSRWGNRYAAGMLGLAVNDATSGFRAYSVEALQKMNFESVTAEGYGFQVEMTHRLVRCNGRIVEIPIVFTDRVQGESKLSHHIIGEAFRLVTSLAWKDWRRGRRRTS